MLKCASFWEEEANAPLLDLEHGALQGEKQKEILERVAKWPQLAGLPADLPEFIPPTQEPSRIVEKDAERTFKSERCRQIQREVLSAIEIELGDYGQGAAYATGFLLLFLEQNEVYELCIKLLKNEKYIPGFWGEEAVPSVVDAHVFGRMMQQFFPAVAAHLQAICLAPKTFTQKWFVGLGIHVLHYEGLFVFWEHFLEQGHGFLFKFALSAIACMQEQILATQHHATIYEWLRMDESKADDELRMKVVQGAVTMEVDPSFHDAIKHLRKIVYDEEVKPNMDKIALSKAKQEAEDGGDDFWSGSDGEDMCELCNENSPAVYCNDCGAPVCSECDMNPPRDAPKQHSKKHATIDFDEYERRNAAAESDEDALAAKMASVKS